MFSGEGRLPVTNVTLQNEDKPELPFIFSFDDNYPYSPEDKLFIPPFLSHSRQMNLFTQESRELPVDLVYQTGEAFTSEIIIPENYSVEYIPEDTEHTGNVIVYTYKTIREEDKIKIIEKYQFNKSIFEHEEYKELKETYAEMIKLFNDPVIFKRNQ
ncbi:MAG: hypothetical protein LIO93_01075 [Bacteroidales bacterium]|nr:hypothetical protein [Bacteroidales bacterium]